MNKELLLKVKAAILAEPRQFNMKYWFSKGIGQIPNCGTAACIAGWAVAIDKQLNPLQAAVSIAPAFEGRHVYSFNLLDEANTMESKARNLLDLTKEQAKALFYNTDWPIQFWEDYRIAGNLASPESEIARAKVAAARIDHLIETGE